MLVLHREECTSPEQKFIAGGSAMYRGERYVHLAMMPSLFFSIRLRKFRWGLYGR